jgi:hypothetical protein
MSPRSNSESLSPFGNLFAFVLMIACRNSVVSKKRHLKLFFGGNLQIQSSVSLKSLTESDILDLVDHSYVDVILIKQTDITNWRTFPTANAMLLR